MKKTNLPTFVSNNVQLKVLVNNQYLTLKEERKLMSRFAIAGRCCSDIHLPDYFHMCEFYTPNTPKCLFKPDWNLHKCIDKVNVADEIYNLQASVMLDDAALNRESNEENKVIIFDGVPKVNLTGIKKQAIKRCSDFANAVATAWKLSVFGVILVRMRENADQNNSKYGHFYAVCQSCC